MALDDILARVAAFGCRHVVVTGGEPLLPPDIVPLCAALRRAGHHVTIETAGTVFRPVECDLVSISPKLRNSTPEGRFALRHERLRLRPEVIGRLMGLAEFQLKFVIDRPEDIAEVLDLLGHLPAVSPDRVLLMPQGLNREDLDRRGAWVAELCKRHGFRLCSRLHIELYGNRRGT
jgi:7-carboxy-7-deazaguanine synthase